MKRKITIILLAVLMVAAYSVPALNPQIEVFAVSKTQDEAISWAKSKVGTSIDTDGYPTDQPYQCVDLVKAYYSYLGASQVSGNGKDYATNALPSGWTRVQGGTPKKGDVLVYGASSGNPYGHVAIYESDYSTYHQNVDGAYVRNITNIKYNGFSNPYWGYIRPDWNDFGELANPGADFYANLGIYYSSEGAFKSMGVNAKNNYNVGFVGGNDPTTDEGKVQSDTYKSRFWHYVRNADGSYRISNCMYSNYYLTAAGTAVDSNVKAVEGYNSNDDKQKWFIYGKWSGEYVMKNGASANVLWYNPSCNLQIKAKNNTNLPNEKIQIYKFDPISGTSTLTVKATTEDQDTVFTWTKPTGDVAWYNIWIHKLNSAGQVETDYSYLARNMLADNTKSQFSKSISLPAGNYEAKIVPHSWVNALFPDYVKFTVESGAPACAHSNTEIRNARAATCTEAGYSGDRYCKDCNTLISAGTVIPASGHSFSTSFTVDQPATCTEAGSQSKHCIRCDERSDVTVIPATGHDFGEWTTIDAGSCEGGAVKQHTCRTCGFTETESLNPGGHDWETEYTVDVPATCTTSGSQSRHCRKCGATTDSVVIPAKGHHFSDWVITQNATCTEDGSRYKECSDCGEVITAVIAATGHKWSADYTVDKEATCSEAGAKSIHCIECNSVKPGSSQEIPAGAHKFGSWSITKAATCTRDGEQSRECTLCGQTETQTIYANGHEWNSGTIKEKATCTEDGIKTHTCLACGDEMDEMIPALGHSWDESYTTDMAATCSAEGIRSIHCTRCDRIKAGSEEVIPKKAHTMGSWTTVKAATCTETGIRESECSVCHTIVQNDIPKAAHSWKTTYTVDKKATYAAAGSKSYHCSVCNSVNSASIVDIPKLTVKKTSLSKLTPARKAITVKWTKQSGVKGYKIQYSLKSNFSGAKTVTIKSAGTASKKIKSLKAKKKYYVRIRTYVTENGKTYYSAWSAKKSVKTK